MASNTLRWGILYCPKGSKFRPHKRWEKIEKALKDNKIDFDFVHSESSASVERLVKMFINSGYQTIIIVGGDSALNDTVNCLMQIEAPIREKISIGLIPNGVMNDFAHFWYMNDDEDARLIKSLKKQRIKKIDLGYIRYQNAQDEACRRYFLNCVNVGFIANLMNIRRKTRHWLKSRPLSFLFSFILMIFQRQEYKMKLKVNTDYIKRKVISVCVGNSLGYGQTPNAVPYNGQLDVTVVNHSEMTQLFDGIYLFIRGKFLNHRNIMPYRTKKVDFIETENAMVGIDGRLMKTPKGGFSIGIEPEAINFLLPD